jgi:hypothetical protein
MAYVGYVPDRETHKYCCPAKHERWECPMSSFCNAQTEYGKTVRVNRDIVLRRIPALPRATKKFERLYKGRTAMERMNARLKNFWGLDDGNLKGASRFHAWVGAVMAVHAGFATLLASAPRYEGTLGKVRLSPIAKALQPVTASCPPAIHPRIASALGLRADHPPDLQNGRHPPNTPHHRDQAIAPSCSAGQNQGSTVCIANDSQFGDCGLVKQFGQ